MGALVTITGLIIHNLSNHFKIPISQASNIFNFLNIGILISIFLSSWSIEIFSLKNHFNFGFALIILSNLINIFSKNSIMFAYSIFIFGLVGGMTLSIGTFLITYLYENQERTRKMLLADSFFSISGILFPIIYTFILFYKIQWNYLYCIISLIYIIIFILSQRVNFIQCTPSSNQNSTINIKKCFNIQTILLYISALLYILAQISLISWIPEYTIQNIHINIKESSHMISSFWTNYMIGMWFFSYFLKFFNLKKIIIYLSGLSTIIIFLFLQNNHYLLLLFLLSLLGFISSSIYSMIITLASMQTKKPSAKIINFTLVFGTIGTFLTFIITSPIIQNYGIKSSLILSNTLYLIVFIIFIIFYNISKKKKYKNLLKIK
jgi:TsgA-like MFS transporter